MERYVPEVSDASHKAAVKKDVLRFDVAVQHPFVMQVHHAKSNVKGDGEALPDVELHPVAMKHVVEAAHAVIFEHNAH